VTATPGAQGLYVQNTYGTTTEQRLRHDEHDRHDDGQQLDEHNPGSNTLSNTSTITTNGPGPRRRRAPSAPTAGTTVVERGQLGGNALTSASTGTGSSTNVLSAVFSADQFKLVLSALQQLNNSKIVSNPTIVTLNNTEASINVGQQYPIPSYTFNQQTGTFQVDGFIYKDIGIILKVTPAGERARLHQADAAPEVSQNQGTTTFGGASGASIPIIGTRKAVTQVSLKDGYTMGIGGLISTNFNTSGRTRSRSWGPSR
jgi:type II secretory pathway component GspD/PulD (secretin)